MSGMDGNWVLIGHTEHGHVKAFGPFDAADEARDFCNMLGEQPAEWRVVQMLPA